MDTVKTRITEALKRCGVFLGEGSDDAAALDSFSYINAVIELENEFGIEIPDGYMAENIFTSLDNVHGVVSELTGLN